MNEEYQRRLYNNMQLEQILLVLESLDNEIDQESLICLLDFEKINQLYFHYKKLDNLFFFIPKMYMAQINEVYQYFMEQNETDDLRKIVNYTSDL